MNLYSALVTIVAIWGVVQVTRLWMEKRRADSGGAAGEVDADELEEMRRRIETLERIITDDKESLRRKFDDL